ncbi:MAG: hypothetical protein M1840_005209 [Geoglossum simile]|nr:MAG: hypothetical protein M1840_005209 [Geoglossum simile]
MAVCLVYQSLRQFVRKLLTDWLYTQINLEAPKAVASSSRWVAFKQCLIPLAPVPITILIVTLNFKQYFAWGVKNHSTEATNELLNVFQFGSTAYSILIVASTAAIVLHRLRYELLEGDGIPLGCILTGYQLNNVKPLATMEFWAGLLKSWPGKTRWRHVSFVTFILWALVTVNVGPPMTAIAVIPKLGWWGVGEAKILKQSDKEESITIDRLFISNSTELWPNHLTADLIPDESCTTSNATLNETCPAAGYSAISETVPNWNPLSLESWNITFFHDYASRNLQSYVQAPSVAVIFSLGQVFARSLANYYSWAKVNWKVVMTRKNMGHILMPYVVVDCNLSPSDTSMIEIPYYDIASEVNNPRIWISNQSYFLSNDAHTSNPVQFTWVDLEQSDASPALGTAFRLNQNVTFINETLNNPVFACSINAFWVSVVPSMEPLEGTVVTPTPVYRSTGITIDSGWARALNIPLSGSNLTTIESIINDLTYRVQDGTTSISDFGANAASAIGLMVTDGISRLGWNERFVFTTHDSADTLTTITNNGTTLSATSSADINPDWVELEIEVFQTGYSYSVRTVTVRIAIVILLLHSLVAVIHTIILCFLRRPWTSQSWGTVGELVLLALNSRLVRENSANANTGAEEQTWNQPLRVREVGEGHLEILVGGIPGDAERGTAVFYEKVQPGKAYGGDALRETP